MLCTKSPNRFRYADIFDGEFADLVFSSTAVASESTESKEALAEPRDRRPSTELETTPEACPDELTDGSTCECEWVCPCPSSSPPKTRSVFSMMKNAAKPTKIPSLHER
jgi:hypothetical protein